MAQTWFTNTPCQPATTTWHWFKCCYFLLLVLTIATRKPELQAEECCGSHRTITPWRSSFQCIVIMILTGDQNKANYTAFLLTFKGWCLVTLDSDDCGWGDLWIKGGKRLTNYNWKPVATDVHVLTRLLGMVQKWYKASAWVRCWMEIFCRCACGERVLRETVKSCHTKFFFEFKFQIWNEVIWPWPVNLAFEHVLSQSEPETQARPDVALHTDSCMSHMRSMQACHLGCVELLWYAMLKCIHLDLHCCRSFYMMQYLHLDEVYKRCLTEDVHSIIKFLATKLPNSIPVFPEW